MKKKMETSKKLAWLSGICFIITLIYAMVIFAYSTMADKACDFTMLVTLITTTGAVFGTTVAFYYNKSKNENAIKLKRSFLKIKYIILKAIGSLDEARINMELENELSKIECDLDTIEEKAKEDITYNN